MGSRSWMWGLAVLCLGLGLGLAPLAQAQEPQLRGSWSFGGPASSGLWTLALQFQSHEPGASTTALPLFKYSADRAATPRIPAAEGGDASPSLWPYAWGAVAIAVALALAESEKNEGNTNTGNGPDGNGAGFLCTNGECVIPCENSPDCFLQAR